MNQYQSQNRGKIIRDASREEYLQAELEDARLGSSLAMAGFFIAAMVYLSKSKD